MNIALKQHFYDTMFVVMTNNAKDKIRNELSNMTKLL
jgi:hypothetical protein